MTNELNEFLDEIDRNKPFVKLDKGPVIGIYKGSKMVDSEHKKGEKAMRYAIEVEGVAKTFDTSSERMARAMLASKAVAGDKIQIVRTGEGYDTQYSVQKVEEEKPTEDEQA